MQHEKVQAKQVRVYQNTFTCQGTRSERFNALCGVWGYCGWREASREHKQTKKNEEKRTTPGFISKFLCQSRGILNFLAKHPRIKRIFCFTAPQTIVRNKPLDYMNTT